MSDAPTIAPDSVEPVTVPIRHPTKSDRLHLSITRAEGAGWIVYATGTTHLVGRFVNLSEATRFVRTRRWRYGVDAVVLDDDGDVVRRFAVELPKRAITKGGVRVA